MSGAPSIPRPWWNGWDEKRQIRTNKNPSEDGYTLIVVVFMLALFIIALGVAAPRVAKSIQREREIETMHRGKQYARAVKLYYRRFGRYPPNVDALVNTNEMRFLRRKYIDPTSGKEDWKPIAVGMNKTQNTGFFGKPVVGGGGATGLSGSPGMAGTLGGASPSGSTFGNSGLSNSTNATGLASNPSTDPSATGSSTPTTDANGNPIAGTGSSASSASGSAFGSGPTLGGLGVMGFTPNSPKPSILVWHKKNHYNEWEFFYDPTSDLTMLSGNAGAIGQPAGSTPVGSGPGIGNNPGFGNSSSPGFGNSTGAGPTSAPSSGTPQQ